MSDKEVDVKSGEDAQEINQDDAKKNLPKKLTALERTAQEGEALLKEMGYKEDGEDQGRRRTRSGGRGLPVSSPPAKKEKKAPATTGTGRRGRPPKKVTNNISKDAEEPEKKENERTETPEAEAKVVKDSEKKTEDVKDEEPEAKEEENHTDEKKSKTPEDTKTVSE